MLKILKNYDKVGYYPNKILGIFALMLIVLMNMSIVSRYFFQVSIVWSDEVLRILFQWSIFLGVALLSKDDNLIGLTIIKEKFEVSKFRKIYGTFYYSIILLFSIFFAYEVCKTTFQQIKYGEITAILQIPSFIITLGILCGSILWVFYSICSLSIFLKNSTKKI